MYKFDYLQISRLPSIMGTTKAYITKKLGVQSHTYRKWEKGEMSCESLVKVCNTFRISLSHFLVVGNRPSHPAGASDCIIPEGEWKPVEWHNEAAGTLFGPGGMTGVTNKDASQRLGFASPQIFAQWAASPAAMRVASLVSMLNEFQLDVSLFFKDSNRPLPLPAWEIGNKHISDILQDRMKGHRDMERKYSEALSTVSHLKVELERVRNENRALRAGRESRFREEYISGITAEAPVVYGIPSSERGYAFHLSLWESLPALFEMKAQDFCEGIGMRLDSFYSLKNIHVDLLVKACNMLRISISHFFIPKSEPPVVQDRFYYQMSPRVFVPVENRMDRMKHMFGKHSVTGYTRDELERFSGIYRDGFTGMCEGSGKRSRVLTLVDICTQFNIPPWLFFHDENRKKAIYAQSVNERLFLNAISLEEENERLKAKLKEKKN